jgi:hypothetical protein
VGHNRGALPDLAQFGPSQTEPYDATAVPNIGRLSPRDRAQLDRGDLFVQVSTRAALLYELDLSDFSRLLLLLRSIVGCSPENMGISCGFSFRRDMPFRRSRRQ